jgi:thioredoxin-like negative regulator of GroEL
MLINNLIEEVISMIRITQETDFQQRIDNPELTIAVFKASWCKDCHYIEPFMPDLEQQYAGKLSFIELDRDEFPELCERLNILGIPSFIAFYEGKELIRFVSKLRKTREEIEQFLDRAVEVAAATAAAK